MFLAHRDIESDSYKKSCIRLAKKITGRLLVRINLNDATDDRLLRRLEGISTSVSDETKILYVSQTSSVSGDMALTPMIFSRPEMVFYYRYVPGSKCNIVRYRPTLLNRRHIVDVLRAICGPLDVSEAELDRIRREATEGASAYSRDAPVRCTKWWGEPVTALV